MNITLRYDIISAAWEEREDEMFIRNQEVSSVELERQISIIMTEDANNPGRCKVGPAQIIHELEQYFKRDLTLMKDKIDELIFKVGNATTDHYLECCLKPSWYNKPCWVRRRALFRKWPLA